LKSLLVKRLTIYGLKATGQALWVVDKNFFGR
jgi:hypothetical protein